MIEAPSRSTSTLPAAVPSGQCNTVVRVLSCCMLTQHLEGPQNPKSTCCNASTESNSVCWPARQTHEPRYCMLAVRSKVCDPHPTQFQMSSLSPRLEQTKHPPEGTTPKPAAGTGVTAASATATRTASGLVARRPTTPARTPTPPAVSSRADFVVGHGRPPKSQLFGSFVTGSTRLPHM